jgi:hypothetical protein
MSYKDFPVGSVVYFLHKERVVPAQVYEKIVRTSMDGSKSTYLVKVRSKSKTPTQDGFTVFELDPSNISVFQTPDEIKQFMVERATEAVSSLVDLAVQASLIFENVVSPATADASLPTESDSVEEDYESWHVPAAERPLKGASSKSSAGEYAEVDLGNGQKARIKM